MPELLVLLEQVDAALAARVRERVGMAAAAGPDATARPVRRWRGADQRRSGRAASVSLVPRLRSGNGELSRAVLDEIAQRTEIDWEFVVHKHRGAPLASVACAALVERDDCPRDAVLALVVAMAPERRACATEALEVALRRRVVTPRDVAFEAAPGWSAIRVLEEYARMGDDRLLAPIDVVLAEAAAFLPGGSSAAGEALDFDDAVAAWMWLVTHAPTHPGTFRQLCADAIEVGRKRDRGRPLVLDESALPRVGTTTQLTWLAHSAGGMLGRTDPGIAARVIAELPMYAIHGFIAGAELPAQVVLPAIRAYPDLAGTLAARARHTPETVRELFALRMPKVQNGLLEERSDTETRHAVHLATRQDAPVRVRLNRWSRDRFQDHVGPQREHAALAVYGHHPDLIRAALRDHGERLGTAGVLRGLLSLWQCRGRAALLDPRIAMLLGPTCIEIVQSATRSLYGYRRLRAEVAKYESPAALIAAVRASPGTAERHFPADFWPAAAAAHARDPLPAVAAFHLATNAACPDELRLAICRSHADAADALAGRSREHALVALTHPLAAPQRRDGQRRPRRPEAAWYVGALAYGVITFDEFVDLAHPASRLLEAVESLAPYFPDGYDDAGRVIAEHARRTLGSSPDAWAVALRLAPEFPGTLPELFATAAAVFL